MMISIDFGKRAANACGCSGEKSDGRQTESCASYRITIQSKMYEATIRLETCLMPALTAAPVFAMLSLNNEWLSGEESKEEAGKRECCLFQGRKKEQQGFAAGVKYYVVKGGCSQFK